MATAINVNNVSKRQGNVEALKGVNFSVNRGELYGLIGPDGAGKTTMFRLLTTLLVPDEGTVTVDGFDTVKDYEAIRSRVGYMPGRFSLYQDLTVEENLKFFASVFSTTIEENYDLIKDIYAQIEPFKHRRAGKLSGGMKQKLALSCALVHKPSVLLLDEPTTGVDPVSRYEFWQMLHKLKEENITIVVSTPYMDEAKMCDRIALINHGQILKISTPKDIADDFNDALLEVKGENLYKLMLEIRKMRTVKSCYSFGDSLHVTFSETPDTEGFKKELSELGQGGLTITPIEAGIEDSYMKLADE